MEGGLGMLVSGEMGNLSWCRRVRKVDPGESSLDRRISKADMDTVTGNEESLEKQSEVKEEDPVLGGSSLVPRG